MKKIILPSILMIFASVSSLAASEVLEYKNCMIRKNKYDAQVAEVRKKYNFELYAKLINQSQQSMTIAQKAFDPFQEIVSRVKKDIPVEALMEFDTYAQAIKSEFAKNYKLAQTVDSKELVRGAEMRMSYLQKEFQFQIQKTLKNLGLKVSVEEDFYKKDIVILNLAKNSENYLKLLKKKFPTCKVTNAWPDNRYLKAVLDCPEAEIRFLIQYTDDNRNYEVSAPVLLSMEVSPNGDSKPIHIETLLNEAAGKVIASTRYTYGNGNDIVLNRVAAPVSFEEFQNNKIAQLGAVPDACTAPKTGDESLVESLFSSASLEEENARVLDSK